MFSLDLLKRALKTGNRPVAPCRRLQFESLEPRIALAAAGLVPVGTQPAGPLTGKIVFVSPGHGDQYDVSGQWYLGRSETQEMNEALGTQDQATFFADYLFRAGATIVPLRPIGRQTNEVVLDNDMIQVSYTGSWSDNTVGPRWYDEDYGAGGNDSVKYRSSSISAGETATATYTPNISAAGFYPVYTWASAGTNRTNQLYKINHSGGQTQVRIDHRQVGNGWIYLGTYHFDGGTAGSVVISNQSTAGGSVVIADAIRFGNGMGDVPDGPNGAAQSGGTLSGKPREDEAALLWCYRSIGQGAGNLATFFGVTGSDPNVNAPARLAEYMYQDTNTFGTGVYIAIHSNALPPGNSRGAIGLITSSGSTPHQTDLAAWLGQKVNEDLRAVDQDLGFTWSTRTTYTLTGGYGEFNADDFTNANGVVEMDASLAEVAFHDNAEDALIMRDPRGRDAIARALYHAVVQYFDVWGGLASPATLPTAPVNVRAVSNTGGQVTLNWSAGPTSSAYGAAATGYRIYMSTDGYGFDGGTAVAGGGTTSTTITGLDPNTPYYFKVVATNAGGESPGSEVLTALPSGGTKQVLIVNGFDRFSQSQDFRYTTRQNTGTNITVDRVWSRYNNSFDYVIQVAAAIQAARPGVHFASTSNEAVISGAVNLTDYDTVIWISGEESTADESFGTVEQTKVEQFIAGGGNFFVSGSEIGWDLDRPSGPTAADRAFYNTTLKADYSADNANTYDTSPAAGGIFAGLSNIMFSDGAAFSSLDGQFYNTDYPDVITPLGGAQIALNYVYDDVTGGGAAIQSVGTGGRGNLVMFGFPFETITNATRRAEIIDRVFSFFGLSAIVADNADFNSDGIVDTIDFIIWRRNENTSVPPGTLGDANHDGQVNTTDYQIWQAQFGTSPGSGVATSALAPTGAAATPVSLNQGISGPRGGMIVVANALQLPDAIRFKVGATSPTAPRAQSRQRNIGPSAGLGFLHQQTNLLILATAAPEGKREESAAETSVRSDDGLSESNATDEADVAVACVERFWRLAD